MLHRFTPTGLNYRIFLLDKRVANAEARDEPALRVPVWRRPQPVPHRHQDLGIILVAQGAARFRWWTPEGEEHHCTVGAGQVFGMPGTWLHTVEVANHALVRGMWINPQLFLELGQIPLAEKLADTSLPLTPPWTGDGALYSALCEVWGQTQAELGRESDNKAEVLAALARLAALYFVRVVGAHPPAGTDDSTARVQEVRAWLDRHYMEPVKLDQLAARAGLAVSRFSELFRRETGLSPQNYRLRCRLHHAAGLLETTDWPVGKIGRDCGFSQLTGFYRLFQAEFGHSPGEHRKKSQ